MKNNLDNVFELVDNSLIHENENNKSSPLSRALTLELNKLSEIKDENLILRKLEILDDLLHDETVSIDLKRELSINGLKNVFKISNQDFLKENNGDPIVKILNNNLQLSDSLFAHIIDNLIYFEEDSLNVDLDLLSLMTVKKVQEQTFSEMNVKDNFLISGINSLGDFDIDFCLFLMKDEILETLSQKNDEDDIYNFKSNLEDYLEPNAEDFESLLESIPDVNILNGRSIDKYFLSLNKGALINSNDDILTLLRDPDILGKLEQKNLKVFSPIDKMNFDLNSHEESLFETSPATYSVVEVDEDHNIKEILRFSALTNSTSPVCNDDLEGTFKILNELNLKNIELKFNGEENDEVLFLRESLSIISKNNMKFESIVVNEKYDFVLKEFNQMKQDFKKKTVFKK